MAAPELRPLGIGEILDVSIKLYRKHAKTLWKIVLLVVVPFQLLTVLIQTSATPPQLVTTQTTPGQSPVLNVDGGDLAVWIVGLVAISILGYLVVLLTTAGCMKAISDAYLGAEPDWRESLNFALHKLRSLAWAAFLVVIMLIPAFVALVLPGFWLAISWAFVTPVVLLEGLRGRRALGRSFRLVKGTWWRVFGVIFVATFLAGIVSGIIAAVVAVVTTVNADSAYVARLFVGALGGIASRLLTTPFQTAVTAVLYFDLRVRKEGFDLALLAEHVGVEPPADATPELLPPLPPDPASQPPYWPPPPGWKPQE